MKGITKQTFFIVFTLCITTIAGGLHLPSQATAFSSNDNPLIAVSDNNAPKSDEANDGKYLSYFPIAFKADVWEEVADPQRPNADFDQFYGIAQCRDGEDEDITFAGADNGLYRLGEDNTWIQEEDIPDLIVNNVAFISEDCNFAIAAAYARGDTNQQQAGIWYGSRLAIHTWDWDPVEGPQPDRAKSSTWSLIVFENKLLIGTFEGLRWTNLSNPDNFEPEWNGPGGDLSGFVTSFAVDTNGKLLATVWNDGVYEATSIEAGQWERVPGDPTDKQIYQAARNDLGLVAGTQTALFYTVVEGVWGEANANKERTYAVLANGSSMYAGQRARHVQFSNDGGMNWNPMPELPPVLEGEVEDFKVRGFLIGTDGLLYAGTSSGVWRWTGNP